MATRSTAKSASDTAADATRKALEGTKDAVGGATEEGSRRAESFIADTQKTVTEQFSKMTKGFETFASFGQENVDALVKSSEIAAKAAEGIGSEVGAYSKKAFEDSVAAAQDFASARTVTELFEKQTTFAQTAFEGWMHQATKMNEIYAAAAKDIAAPLGQRVTAAGGAFKAFSA